MLLDDVKKSSRQLVYIKLGTVYPWLFNFIFPRARFQRLDYPVWSERNQKRSRKPHTVMSKPEVKHPLCDHDYGKHEVPSSQKIKVKKIQGIVKVHKHPLRLIFLVWDNLELNYYTDWFTGTYRMKNLLRFPRQTFWHWDKTGFHQILDLDQEYFFFWLTGFLFWNTFLCFKKLYGQDETRFWIASWISLVYPDRIKSVFEPTSNFHSYNLRERVLFLSGGRQWAESESILRASGISCPSR